MVVAANAGGAWSPIGDAARLGCVPKGCKGHGSLQEQHMNKVQESRVRMKLKGNCASIRYTGPLNVQIGLRDQNVKVGVQD